MAVNKNHLSTMNHITDQHHLLMRSSQHERARYNVSKCITHVPPWGIGSQRVPLHICLGVAFRALRSSGGDITIWLGQLLTIGSYQSTDLDESRPVTGKTFALKRTSQIWGTEREVTRTNYRGIKWLRGDLNCLVRNRTRAEGLPLARLWTLIFTSTECDVCHLAN